MLTVQSIALLAMSCAKPHFMHSAVPKEQSCSALSAVDFLGPKGLDILLQLIAAFLLPVLLLPVFQVQAAVDRSVSRLW